MLLHLEKKNVMFWAHCQNLFLILTKINTNLCKQISNATGKARLGMWSKKETISMRKTR